MVDHDNIMRAPQKEVCFHESISSPHVLQIEKNIFSFKIDMIFLLNHNFEVTTLKNLTNNHTVIALVEVKEKTSFLNPSPPAEIGCS